MTAATDRLAEIEGRAEGATKGPWVFASTPDDTSRKTKTEWMTGALTGMGPLYAVYLPESVSDSDAYIVPALTGDGPNARDNAAFIAHARTDVPVMASALRAVLAEINGDGDNVYWSKADCADVIRTDVIRAAITAALSVSEEGK